MFLVIANDGHIVLHAFSFVFFDLFREKFRLSSILLIGWETLFFYFIRFLFIDTYWDGDVIV